MNHMGERAFHLLFIYAVSSLGGIRLSSTCIEVSHLHPSDRPCLWKYTMPVSVQEMIGGVLSVGIYNTYLNPMHLSATCNEKHKYRTPPPPWLHHLLTPPSIKAQNAPATV